VFALVIAVLTTLLGLLALTALPIAQYPEVVPPQIVVTTQYPGANATTVAETVAAPIEQQVNGVENMLYMESQSTNDGSMTLTITFKVGTDPDLAQVLVQNRVAIANAQLPPEVKQIGVTTKKKSTAILLVVNISSPIDPATGRPKRDQLEVSNFATIQVKDELARIDGVGDVSMFGQRDYSMRVWLDPNKMADMDLTAGDVVKAIQAQNVQVAAGQIGQPPVPRGQQLQMVLNTQGRLRTEEQFRNIVLKTAPGGDSEGLVRIRDVVAPRTVVDQGVARQVSDGVELGAKSYDTSSALDNNPAVGLPIFQLPGANAVDTAGRIKAKMKQLEKERFPEGIKYDIVFDPTEFVSESIDEVVRTLFEAFVLVFIVVVVFLQNWRAAVIPMIAVPVSLIGTLAVMLALGYSINNLTLFGMVLAIGIVVDDAIVVVEAVEFHLARGLSPRDATRQAMTEVAQAVIGVSLVLAAVFIPSAFIPGLTGQFFKQFAVTIAVSTLLSAFNSLTLTPALCPLLLRPHHAKKDVGDRILHGGLGWFFRGFNWTFDRATKGYGWTVGRLLRVSVIVLLVYGGLLGLTYLGFNTVPQGFIPQQDQGYVIVNVQLPDGASLERTEAVVRKASELALQTDGVNHTVAIPGYSILSQANVSNYGAMYVPLKSFGERNGRTAADIITDLNKKFAAIDDGVVVAFGAPPILGLGTGGGFKMQILDRGNYGYEALEGMTSNVAVAAGKEPGIVGTVTTFRSSAPQVFLNVDRDRAQQMGVLVSDVNQALQVYLGSYYVNDITLEGRNWQVNVQAEGQYRNTVEAVGRLKVRRTSPPSMVGPPSDVDPNSDMVPLAGLVTMDRMAGPSKVNRYQMYPAADLSGFVNPFVLSSGQALDKMEAIGQRELPPGMGYEWTDLAYQQKLAAEQEVKIGGVELYKGDTTILVFGMSVVIAFLVMAALYESWLLPLAIVLVVPMCLLCAVTGLLVNFMDLNIFSQIGLVVLVGLATKNAILIVEFAKQKREGGLPRHQAAVEAATQRLRPILMTSFAFILGVVPLLTGHGAGSEMRKALGVAVFSGMLGVTAFGIFLTPVFYTVIQRFRDRGEPAAKRPE
jgi:multidrug efflux pump